MNLGQNIFQGTSTLTELLIARRQVLAEGVLSIEEVNKMYVAKRKEFESTKTKEIATVSYAEDIPAMVSEHTTFTVRTKNLTSSKIVVNILGGIIEVVI